MKALSILGCGSGAGKSWMTTALGAWLHSLGVRVAPFKAQNMSNNAWVTLDGGEIGRAQAVQAEACGLIPTVQMNPILLKPSGALGCQVIVLGKSQGHTSGADYYRRVEELWSTVRGVLNQWRSQCDVLLMEGAGSPVELNLRHRDLVNFRPCHYLDGKWVLVADIDRGGVFAQLAGTWSLMSQPERERSLGTIINRFRGDLSLFCEPQHWLAPYARGLMVLGTVPFRDDLQPEEEDGLSSVDRVRGEGDVIAWIRFPHLSNLTDCQPWWQDEGVQTRWVTRPHELTGARVVILPGSKNTVADLQWLRDSELGPAIVAAAKRGVLVIGVCGGYQMLGERLIDEQGIAGDAGNVPGLKLLPTETLFKASKTLRQVWALEESSESAAYEIHMGETRSLSATASLHQVRDEHGFRSEGMQCANVWGTYLHGWFDSPAARRRVARAAGIHAHQAHPIPWAEQRQQTYREMARHLEAHVSLDPVKRYLGI